MVIKRWPGLIDVHVHLRDPGATHKEDFKTASRAAIKGGFTYILDMPNNPIQTITVSRIKQKIRLASKKSLCKVGFHMGTKGKNKEELKKAYKLKQVFGLKIYMDTTTGGMMIGKLDLLERVFSAWGFEKPILVHAEGIHMAVAITLAKIYKRKLHICHVTRVEEVELLRQAKSKGFKITAGTCPHYLFLTNKDRIKQKGFAMMKPVLGSKKDQKALWNGLMDGTLDLIESDHAPHTKEEKTVKHPAFGVPGLETTLGLMLKAVNERKCTLAQVKKWLYTNPKQVFNIPDQKNTYIEFDPEKSYVIGEDGYETKCGWSPFDGMMLYGKVKKAVINNKIILENYEFKS